MSPKSVKTEKCYLKLVKLSGDIKNEVFLVRYMDFQGHTISWLTGASHFHL